MDTKSTIWRLALLCLVGASFRGEPVRAQEAEGGAEEKTELAPSYVDGSFGFSIRPPAGSETIREKQPRGVADFELVRFRIMEKKWSLAVRFAQTTKPIDTQMAVEEITASLAQHGEVKVLRGEDARIDGREGIRFAASFVMKEDHLLRQQAVVRFKPTEYFAIVFITPDQDREAQFELFDRIVESFEILRTATDEKRLEEAVKRGQALLREYRSEKKLLPGREEESHYLRFLMEGKDIGFVEILQKEAEPKGRRGIQIRQTGWLFQEKDQFKWMQQDMFLSHDLIHEIWKNTTLDYLPGEEDGEPVVLSSADQGKRVDDKLIVGSASSMDGISQERVIEVDPSYASAAWLVLMPRLVDLSRPELYTFSSYTADRRGLAMRTYEVIGRKRINVGPRLVEVTEIQDTEGLIPPVNKIYVDDKGLIMKVEAGPLEMIRSDLKEVEKLYGERVKKCEALLQRNKPIPPREKSGTEAGKGGF